MPFLSGNQFLFYILGKQVSLAENDSSISVSELMATEFHCDTHHQAKEIVPSSHCMKLGIADKIAFNLSTDPSLLVIKFMLAQMYRYLVWLCEGVRNPRDPSHAKHLSV